MRIHGPNGASAAVAASAGRRAPPGAFALGGAETARSPAAPVALRTVSGIEALIALQGLEDATERRKHGVKRGRVALDALDELKIGLLGGMLSQGTLSKLRSAAASLKDGSGDATLDSLLGEIELRVEVEIAKVTPR
jgi:hypothetical protein